MKISAFLSDDEHARVTAPLEEAWTLPARTYTDPDVYDAEVDALFRRQWLCVGRVDQVPAAGDYLTVDLLGEPLVLVRGKDDAIRVLSRVCRHRAADLLPGGATPRQGNAPNFSCPYHAWSYRLDGRLMAAPLMQDARGFDRSTCGLPEIRTEVWNGFVFMNLSGDAEPLGTQLAGLDRYIGQYKMSEMVSREVAVYDSPWHWRVLVENFMEAYHHTMTHRDTLQPIFPAADSFVPDTRGPYSILVMPAAEKGALEALSTLPHIAGLNEQQKSSLLAAVVFPFHLFALTPETLTWYQLFPLGHGRFTLKIFACYTPESASDPGFAEARGAQADLLGIIHGQDIEACDAVWTGLQSRTAAPGPLCPLEKSIWQLNAWWLEQMRAA